jgi:HNH endonuclease
LFPKLFPKVKYDENNHVVWVVNYVKRQFLRNQKLSPKIKEAINKSLAILPRKHPFVREFKLLYCDFFEDQLRGEISINKREAIWVRDGGICQYCGRDVGDEAVYEMEHVIPISQGGNDRYDNLVCSCKECNQQKGERTPSQAGLPDPAPFFFSLEDAIGKLLEDQPLREKFVYCFKKEIALYIDYQDRVSRTRDTLQERERDRERDKDGVDGKKKEKEGAGEKEKGKGTNGFACFWDAYPKKKSKGQAEKAWLKIKPNEQLLATMLAKIEQARTSVEWTREGGQFIPHPATWLNAKGWEDEYTPPSQFSSQPGMDAWLKRKLEEEGE